MLSGMDLTAAPGYAVVTTVGLVDHYAASRRAAHLLGAVGAWVEGKVLIPRVLERGLSPAIEPRSILARLGAAPGALIGLGGFLLIANLHILMPTNIAWLQRGDPASHYLTWATFRHGPWTFPPGANPAYGLELAGSVLFNDAIPLLALSFKPFSGLLSEPFQYFGLWIFACFLLQGFFAWKIGQLLGLKPIALVLFTCLLVLAPPFIGRIHWHLALGAHWLVLAALYLYLRPAPKSLAYAWIALLVVAVLVQPYLFGMVGAIWVADIVKRGWLGETESRIVIGEAVVAIGLVTAALWMAGFFGIGSGRSVRGFGIYHLDLLGPFNSAGWSQLFPPFRFAANEFEGFSYFGLGGFLLIALAVPGLVKGEAKPLLDKCWLPLLAALVLLTLYAITNQITIATKPIVTVPLPQWTYDLAGTFRTSARMFWPAYYAILIGATWIVVKRYGAQAASLVLIPVAVLQVIDTSAGWDSVRERFASRGSAWTTPLQSPWWEAAAKRYKKVRALPSFTPALHWEEIGYYALTHNLETDETYFSRIDEEKFRAVKADSIRVLQGGTTEPDTLYILGSPGFAASLQGVDEDDMLANIDDHWVFAPGGAELARKFGIAPHPRPDDFGLAPPLARIGFDHRSWATVFLGPGWSHPEPWGVWSAESIATLVFCLTRPPKDLRLSFRGRGLPPTAGGRQQIAAFFGGERVAEVALGLEWSDFEIVIPAALVKETGGCQGLDFHIAQPTSPTALGMNNDKRELGLALISLEARPE
jgi:hypothetical protein